MKLILTSVFLAFLIQSNLSFAQNPTVINDSLVVNNRVYAKEKLIVDKEAKFKQDIKVLGSARIQTDLRVDSTLRVDGNAKFFGNVKMEGLGTASGLTNDSEFIIILPNGQLKKATFGALNEIIYFPFLCQDGDIANPVWSNGLNKIFSACDIVKVGIGTSAPNYKLDVRGTTYSFKFLAGNSGATSDALYNGFSQNNSQDLMQLGVKVGGGAENVRFSVSNAGNIIATNIGNQTTLTLNNGSGHAIVVNSSNGTKILQLQDDGILYSRGVKVNLDTWADYVFKQGYKMMTLTETENFINEHGHLPGVPSEKELKKNGLDLAEMQKIQMEKIEEMYLHMIQMNKEIESLKSEVSGLKIENEQLKK